MSESDEALRAGSSAQALAVALGFWVYTIALFLIVRQSAHHAFDGWLARVATMAGIAVGLWPWARWLGPRIRRALDVFGRAALVLCYFLCLPLFVLVTRLTGHSFRRRPLAGSQWCLRRPTLTTLDAARREA